jgi:HTH-type transcriptional regulator / antitoxin HigA
MQARSEVSVRPLRSDADLEWALGQIDELLDAPPDSPEYDRLDVLSTLVESYEAKTHPIPPPDPVDAILFRMEQQALMRKDLEKILGSRSRVTEVLKRQRSLSLPMIRALHEELGIPLASLVGSRESSRLKPRGGLR